MTARRPAQRAPRPREALADVWDNPSLIRSFLHRQIRTRFLGSRLGWVWSLVNPLAMLAAYSLVFGVILGADRGMEPSASGMHLFAVFLFTGLVCWNIFTSVLTQTVDGMLDLMPLRRKVAFPVLGPLLGLAAATVVERSSEIVLLLVVYAVVGNLGWSMLAVPFLVLLVAAFGFGLGLALAILNVTYRDVGHLIGVALQMYFYATPIIYPPSFIDSKLQSGTALHAILVGNPLAQFVGAFRETMWQLRLPSATTWATLAAWALGALVIGWLLFRDRAYRIGEES